MTGPICERGDDDCEAPAVYRVENRKMLGGNPHATSRTFYYSCELHAPPPEWRTPYNTVPIERQESC